MVMQSKAFLIHPPPVTQSSRSSPPLTCHVEHDSTLFQNHLMHLHSFAGADLVGVFLLQNQLRGRTFSAPRKSMRGKGRVTIQFGCCYNYARDSKGRDPGMHSSLVAQDDDGVLMLCSDWLVGCELLFIFQCQWLMWRPASAGRDCSMSLW